MENISSVDAVSAQSQPNRRRIQERVTKWIVDRAHFVTRSNSLDHPIGGHSICQLSSHS